MNIRIFIRKRLELSKEETIFMLVDGKSTIAGETALQDIYDKYKDKEDIVFYTKNYIII